MGIYVGLGSNLGDSAGTLRAALAELSQLPGCRVIGHSSLYRTAPIAGAPERGAGAPARQRLAVAGQDSGALTRTAASGRAGGDATAEVRMTPAQPSGARHPAPGSHLPHAAGTAPPFAGAPQPDYVNAVAELETGLSPAELMAALLALEARHGRRRTVADAPRTLDLDLLLYGDRVLDQPGLKLPHPRMHLRAFVLRPLLEIAPDCEIPGHGPARDCLTRLSGQRVEVLA